MLLEAAARGSRDPPAVPRLQGPVGEKREWSLGGLHFYNIYVKTQTDFKLYQWIVSGRHLQSFADVYQLLWCQLGDLCAVKVYVSVTYCLCLWINTELGWASQLLSIWC